MNQFNNEKRRERIRRYILDAGETADSKRLENEMFEDDELFREVQIEELLREGLVTTKMESAVEGVRGMPRGSARWPRYAVIGLFSLAVVGLGVRLHTVTSELRTLSAPQARVPVITLFEQRALTPSDTGAPAGGHALLEVDVSAWPDKSFTVTLSHAGGKSSWEGQVADERGYLTVYVPEMQEDMELAIRSADGEIIRTYRIH